MRSSQPIQFLIQSVYLQKTSEQGVRTHPPMVLSAMGDILCCYDDIRWWQGYPSPYRRLTEIVVGDRGSDLLSLHLVPSTLPDMRARHVYPDGVIRIVCVLRVNMRFRFSLRFKKMSAKKKAVSSVQASDAREKSIDKLNAKEFRDRFCIPNGCDCELLNEESLLPTEKAEGKCHHFLKRSIQHGLRFPLPALFKEFFHFFPDSTRLHPSQHSPGADGMQHYKHAVQSRPLTAGAVGFNEGRGEGTCDGPGSVGGAIGASGRGLFLQTTPRCFQVSPERKGHIVDWVEKASFACLNKLFEIDANERHYGTLLTARNLMAVVRESQEYVVNILPKKMPNEVVPGEHYILKDLPIYQEVKEADAEKRRALLDDREKRKNEGTLRKAPGQKRSAASPPRKAPAKRGSWSPSKRSCSARQSKVRTHRRLQDRLQEIEVSCSSAHDAHPEGREVEMAIETLAVPVVVPDEDAPGETYLAKNVEAPNPEEESPSIASSGGNSVNDAACTSTSPFSYAELEEKLKQIPLGLTTVMPSAKMFEMVETLVSGLRGMAQQHDLFTDLLQTTDYMKAFASQRKNSPPTDLAEAKSREESMEARLHEAEDEMARLRGDVRQLRTEASIEKKQKEDLQLRLVAQKEELEGEFAADREALEADYQKQVDDMFFFGYRCCMKKNGIKRDVPSIRPGEEKKLLDKPVP
ncbi:hypothetical protein CK203_059085 [Vitis vinifera]|uniref:Uncharacterized protein n=1 Tax=Vitis vinifera TaxID=29760 RepID=A0A438GTV2_VITVI|nr:hypothetical protein CK203_059085 [Vitis vinifera]